MLKTLLTAVILACVLLAVGCGGAADEAETPATTADADTVTQKLFLSGYDGQSIGELLAMTDTYRVDSVVLAIQEALQRKPPSDLSAPERAVLAVEALEREVNNGGYSQFFANEPGYAHEVVSALREIGSPETARITRQAGVALGLHPDWTDDQIQTAAANISMDQMETLDSLDDQFLAYPEPIEDRLLAFIRAHVAQITL